MHIGQLYPYWIHIVPILVTGSILYTYWTIVPILDDCTHIGPILYPYCTHNGSILDPYWSLFIPRQGWGPLVLLLVETSRRHSQTAQSGRGPWSEMEVKLKTQTFQKRTRNESTWHHGEGKRQRARYEGCKSTQRGHSAQGPAGNFSFSWLLFPHSCPNVHFIMYFCFIRFVKFAKQSASHILVNTMWYETFS